QIGFCDVLIATFALRMRSISRSLGDWMQHSSLLTEVWPPDGRKRRDARAPVDPRPNAVLGRAPSHLSPRAIGGRRLCRTGFADLRGAPHRGVSCVCTLCERMGARRLR